MMEPTPSASWPTDQFESSMDRLGRAPEPVLRAVLFALCDDFRVKNRAVSYMDRLLRYDQLQRTERQCGASRVTALASPRKRKAAGSPKICVQCDQIFTGEEDEYDCAYHSGELELFDETKIVADWEVVSAEDLVTEANRIQYPEAFRWCCCERFGDNRGCVRGRHEANPELSKKGRGSEPPDLDNDPLLLDDPLLPPTPPPLGQGPRGIDRLENWVRGHVEAEEEDEEDATPGGDGSKDRSKSTASVPSAPREATHTFKTRAG